MGLRPATSSGRLTADAAIVARPALLKFVIVEADGTNAANVIIYDNASAASGNILCKVLVPAGSAYALFQHHDGVEANKGIYADISGTGAACIIGYSEM